jgi:hypothetical protein
VIAEAGFLGGFIAGLLTFGQLCRILHIFSRPPAPLNSRRPFDTCAEFCTS